MTNQTSHEGSRIAIDIDDVLANHAESFVAFSNNFYGTSLKPENYNEHWAEIWNVDNEEVERRASEFHIPEEIAAFEVKKDSITALQKLSAHYDLYIVTARREHLVDITIDWVNKYFPNIFKGIHFVPIWEPGNSVTKADICKQISADYLIDDLPKHCNVAADGGIKAIVFGDYSWNRDENLHKEVVKCKDWDEVLDHFHLS